MSQGGRCDARRTRVCHHVASAFVAAADRGSTDANMPPSNLSPDDRARIQRRTLRVLVGGQVVGAAALGAAVTVGAFVVQDILGDDTPFAGLATATVTMGTAFMSQVLARVMLRHGRRGGLQVGYALAAVGGVVAAAGVEAESLPWFLLGLFLFGNGQAANLLARYAATDLAAPTERSSAMSHVVFASTFGAVFGPLLITPAQWAGETWFGLASYSGPWLVSSVFLVLAALNTAIRLRPDPLVVSGATAKTPTRMGIAEAFRLITSTGNGRLALTAMVVSQATMVSVMTMTPVHLKLYGHESLSPYVVSLHIAGMFAFSPLVGKYADRHGRINAIFLGAVLLVIASVLSAISGEGNPMLFPSLWLLGIGWNFGLIGGSTLLVESIDDAVRVRVQGTADLLMSFCGGLAGFSSGFIRRAVGFHLLSTASLVLAFVLLVYVVVGSAHVRPSVVSSLRRR